MENVSAIMKPNNSFLISAGKVQLPLGGGGLARFFFMQHSLTHYNTMERRNQGMAFKDEYITAKEAAAELGITCKFIAPALCRLKHRKKNPLPFYSIGKKHYYPRVGIAEWKRKNVVRG